MPYVMALPLWATYILPLVLWPMAALFSHASCSWHVVMWGWEGRLNWVSVDDRRFLWVIKESKVYSPQLNWYCGKLFIYSKQTFLSLHIIIDTVLAAIIIKNTLLYHTCIRRHVAHGSTAPSCTSYTQGKHAKAHSAQASVSVIILCMNNNIVRPYHCRPGTIQVSRSRWMPSFIHSIIAGS